MLLSVAHVLQEPFAGDLTSETLFARFTVHSSPQKGSSWRSRQSRIWSLSISGARAQNSAVLVMSCGSRPAAFHWWRMNAERS